MRYLVSIRYRGIENSPASIDNLGVALGSQGKHAEAEQVLGSEHSSTLNSINNLGIALSSQGKHAEAEQLHRQAQGAGARLRAPVNA